MEEHSTKKAQIIQWNESAVRDHLGEMVRNTVEDTLNTMLDAEADRLCEKLGTLPVFPKDCFKIWELP